MATKEIKLWNIETRETVPVSVTNEAIETTADDTIPVKYIYMWDIVTREKVAIKVLNGKLAITG